MKCGLGYRELGGAIDAALPRQITRDALKLNLVRGDVFTIMWWARAMHKAAKELVAMRTFLDQRDAATLAADQGLPECAGETLRGACRSRLDD